MTTCFDLTQIPTGEDGKPDKARMIELLRMQLSDLMDQLEASARREADVYERGRENAEAVKRLRMREVKVLERWVRRRAISRERLDHAALLVVGAMVAVPLFIVVLSFAWRLAVWAVAG